MPIAATQNSTATGGNGDAQVVLIFAPRARPDQTNAPQKC